MLFKEKIEISHLRVIVVTFIHNISYVFILQQVFYARMSERSNCSNANMSERSNCSNENMLSGKNDEVIIFLFI